MELTTEEKIEKIKQYEHWVAFTGPQQTFLLGCAKGLTATEAFVAAYPDVKSDKDLVFAVGSMLSRVGVKKALATIGIDTRKPNVTRTEAMELLSRQLRKCDDANKIVKLLGMYSKLAGWEKSAEPDEGVSMDKLVSAMEKKRKTS